MGKVVGIYLRPSARTPVRRVDSTEALVDQGLEGDHAGAGPRQVTLIEREKWEEACDELSRELDSGIRRANIVVEGVALQSAIGKQLQLGEALLEIVGELRPCKLMDDSAPGLQEALSPDCRGGVYGRVVQGGPGKVGASVRIPT